ncbi:MAG: 3-methyl-2-oxobutanoate hydroxymethyltransferase [Planctomycetota bacterium]
MDKANVNDFRRWKREGQPFATLTAYDAPSARMCAAAEIPLILVGDSVSNVVLGYDDTRPVTMDEMIHHTKAVRRGAPQTFVVGDLPFMSYQVSPEEAVVNAGRFVKECRVDAVKLEGGSAVVPAIERIVAAGIPVMGHLGLLPQTAAMQQGGMRVQGTDAEAAITLVAEAKALVAAGIFAVVLECIPQELAKIITAEIPVPTIGIGAGPDCDGQILVLHDMLGIESGYQPRFVRRYAEIEDAMVAAMRSYARDVQERGFPNEKESFHMPDEELSRFGEKRGIRETGGTRDGGTNSE